MSSFSMSGLTKALPSVYRQCYSKNLPTRTVRLFSTSPRTHKTKQEQSREFESQLLDQAPPGPESATEAAPLSAITRMMQGVGNLKGDKRVGDGLAESLEANMTRNPYSDRAPPHHLHVYTHKHNTVLTLTRPDGNPIFTMTCGQLGFRKAGRSGFDPAYQLSAHCLAQIQQRGILMEIKALEIIFRGFGKGRDAFTKVILGNEGRNIRGLVTRVTDATRLKFGGTRSKRTRRL